MLAGKNMGMRFGFLLAALLLGALGCSEDDPVVPPGPGPLSSLTWPGSPPQLMDNFQTIYETRDFGEYELILAPGFETYLQGETIQDFPGVGETLDVEEELRIHDRMFSGDPVTDSNGHLVPGVLNISFANFTPLGHWFESLPTDPIPDSEWALYNVEILMDRGQQYSTLKIDGTIKFYVTSKDSLRYDGTLKPYYQMIGQVDLTNGFKSVENNPWGSVKAMFW